MRFVLRFSPLPSATARARSRARLASCFWAMRREPGAQVGIELGVGVERALGEHDEVVVAVQLVGEREVLRR